MATALSRSWLRALISKIIRVGSDEMTNRRALRLIAGTNVTLTPQDSALSDETRVTISAGEGGGQNIEEVLTVGSDADGKPIRNIGSSDGLGTYKTNGNISSSTDGTVADTVSLVHLILQPIEVGFQRTTWLVTVRTAADATWGFDWLSHVRWVGDGDGVLSLSKALVEPGDMEGTPPDISIVVTTVDDTIGLTLTNNSGGPLDVRIGTDSIVEMPLA